MARRTPQELAAHHEAQAKKHALKARVFNDPILRDVIALRDKLDSRIGRGIQGSFTASQHEAASDAATALSKLAEVL